MLFRKLFGFIVLVGFSVSAMAYDMDSDDIGTLIDKSKILKKNDEKTKILENGVIFYEDVEREYKLLSSDKYNLVVIDRSKPFRIRPIVDFTIDNKKGRFKTHSVLNHIKNKGGKIVVAAINGDMFSHQDGTDTYKDGKIAIPERTFIYNGIDLNFNSKKPEPIISFSNNYNRLDIDLSFHNITSEKAVSDKYDFDKKYKKYLGKANYDSSETSYINNDSLQISGKTSFKETPIDWSIGLTQGSVWGTRYKDGSLKNNICSNPKGSPKSFYSWDLDSHAPMIGFNDNYVILAVSKSEIDNNEDVCDFFKELGINYVAYLDAGGSTQMIIKNNSNEYKNKSPDNQDRAVISALAVVKAYPDLSLDSDKEEMKKKYREAIYYLTDFGIISGNDKGKFEPNKFINRAEVSKMIIKILDLMGKERCDKCEKYKDYETTSHWFYTSGYAQNVICRGIKEGENNTKKLNLDEKISYMELSKMIRIAFKGPMEGKDSTADWSKKYFDYLNTKYEDRFSEKYGVLDLDTRSWEQQTDAETIQEKSSFAKRKEVALFLYRAFILWQDGKFGKYESECEK